MKARVTRLVAVFVLAGMVLINLRVPMGDAASQTNINSAIERGLAYLNSTQASDGSWGGGSYPVACTAMAVLAFENAPNSHFGWNLTDPYHLTVQKGFDYLFSKASVEPLSIQSAGNPEGNAGNGIGICFTDGRYPIYETPMVLMAMVASQAPTNVTSSGRANVTGRTYHDVAVDIVDYLAWAQNENGAGRGGWRYEPNSVDSDNSVTQWPVLGFMAAELWDINPSDWVKSELISYWLNTTQNLSGTSETNGFYGAFGYGTGPSGPTRLDSIAETAAGILGLTYCGVPKTDSRVVAAQGYIVRDWNTTSGGPEGWRVNMGNFYAMYGVMKACRLTVHEEGFDEPIEKIANYAGNPTIEWYNGSNMYADALVINQSADGHWDQWVHPEDVATELSTAWGVLILEFVPWRVEWTLTVNVLDANTDSPISQATVEAAGPQKLEGFTDGGAVVFVKIQAGKYSVTTSKTNYTPESVNVNLVSDTEITIRLTPLEDNNCLLWILAAIVALVLAVGMVLAFILIADAERIRRRRKKKSC